MENVNIELIDKNKLKAVLSCLDILNLDCDVSELFGESLSHNLIDEILKKAYDKFSFKADISKIMVEAMPSQTDGYIVFITKIEDDDLLKSTKENIAIYSFSNLSQLKRGISEIKNIFYGSSSLFELDGKYYLVLNSDIRQNFKKTKIILTEFGDRINDSFLFISVLHEYGKKIFEKTSINSIKNNI